MDREGFRVYLQKGGRSPSATHRCLKFVSEFEDNLREYKDGKMLTEATDQDLLDFALKLDANSKTKAKGYLWAIRYYYDYVSDDDMKAYAGRLREQRIVRSPFSLKKFRGVNQDYVHTLADAGIYNINQMLNESAVPKQRHELSKKTGIPEGAILEFAKLSDLARIPGVKGIRARLYYDAGIDTVEKIAAIEPEDLRNRIVKFVEETGFEGVATLPAEARYTVDKARSLPRILEI